MPKSLKQRRRTPWDAKPLNCLGSSPFSRCESTNALESARTRPNREEVIRLHGLYVFDPSQVTSDDFRQFMWSGLRLLRAQAKARGLSEDEVRRLLVSAFDAFQDAAESMWTALKTVMLTEEPHPVERQTVAIQADPFVACEEDRPVPIKIDLSKPLTLLDPDAELLSSFEP